MDFAEEIVRGLEAAKVTYAITGSIASSLWGTPRLTHDVDVLVMLQVENISHIVASFANKYYLEEQTVREAVRSSGMFNIVAPELGFKADLWVSAGDEFSECMLSRRRRVKAPGDFEAEFGSPEDVLLHKLVWNQITPSERQLGDAAGIAAVQAGKLDLAYMRSWASRQGTLAQLEAVLAGKGLKAT